MIDLETSLYKNQTVCSYKNEHNTKIQLFFNLFAIYYIFTVADYDLCQTLLSVKRKKKQLDYTENKAIGMIFIILKNN